MSLSVDSTTRMFLPALVGVTILRTYMTWFQGQGTSHGIFLAPQQLIILGHRLMYTCTPECPVELLICHPCFVGSLLIPNMKWYFPCCNRSFLDSELASGAWHVYSHLWSTRQFQPYGGQDWGTQLRHLGIRGALGHHLGCHHCLHGNQHRQYPTFSYHTKTVLAWVPFLTNPPAIGCCL